MRPISRIDSQEFTKAVETATTIAEVCEKLAVSQTKGNVAAIRKKAKSLGLSLEQLARFKTPIADKARLSLALEKSETLAEVLLELGVAVNAGNYETLKKYLAFFGLDTSNVKYGQRIAAHRTAEKIKNKIDLKDLLVENSPASRKYIKARILAEKLIPEECAGCQNKGVWRGKPLVLALEHKNGIPNDNRLCNLELLCPNCHSQTETFAGRNKAAKA